jgi:hypothetical protein
MPGGLRKTKRERISAARNVLAEVDQFEQILEKGELEELCDVATPHELVFVQQVAKNLCQLNAWILLRRRQRAEERSW